MNEGGLSSISRSSSSSSLNTQSDNQSIASSKSAKVDAGELSTRLKFIKEGIKSGAFLQKEIPAIFDAGLEGLNELSLKKKETPEAKDAFRRLLKIDILKEKGIGASSSILPSKMSLFNGSIFGKPGEKIDFKNLRTINAEAKEISSDLNEQLEEIVNHTPDGRPLADVKKDHLDRLNSKEARIDNLLRDELHAVNSKTTQQPRKQIQDFLLAQKAEIKSLKTLVEGGYIDSIHDTSVSELVVETKTGNRFEILEKAHDNVSRSLDKLEQKEARGEALSGTEKLLKYHLTHEKGKVHQIAREAFKLTGSEKKAFKFIKDIHTPKEMKDRFGESNFDEAMAPIEKKLNYLNKILKNDSQYETERNLIKKEINLAIGDLERSEELGIKLKEYVNGKPELEKILDKGIFKEALQERFDSRDLAPERKRAAVQQLIDAKRQGIDIKNALKPLLDNAEDPIVKLYALTEKNIPQIDEKNVEAFVKVLSEEKLFNELKDEFVLKQELNQLIDRLDDTGIQKINAALIKEGLNPHLLADLLGKEASDKVLNNVGAIKIGDVIKKKSMFDVGYKNRFDRASDIQQSILTEQMQKKPLMPNGFNLENQETNWVMQNKETVLMALKGKPDLDLNNYNSTPVLEAKNRLLEQFKLEEKNKGEFNDHVGQMIEVIDTQRTLIVSVIKNIRTLEKVVSDNKGDPTELEKAKRLLDLNNAYLSEAQKLYTKLNEGLQIKPEDNIDLDKAKAIYAQLVDNILTSYQGSTTANFMFMSYMCTKSEYLSKNFERSIFGPAKKAIYNEDPTFDYNILPFQRMSKITLFAKGIEKLSRIDSNESYITEAKEKLGLPETPASEGVVGKLTQADLTGIFNKSFR